MSSAVITPASLPSSSTTGKVSRLYLSNSSVTRSCARPPSLESAFAGQFLQPRVAARQKQPRQRDGAVSRSSLVHQKQRVERFQQLFVAAAPPWRRPPWRFGSATYSVFIMPPAVSSSNSSSSCTSVLGSESISSRISSLRFRPPARKGCRRPRRAPSPPRCRPPFPARAIPECWPASWDRSPESASAATSLSMVSKIASRSAGLRSSTMSARSAGCSVFQLFVTDVRAAAAAAGRAPPRCKVPADGVRRDGLCRRRIQRRGSRPAADAAPCCAARYPLPGREDIALRPPGGSPW
jgi:hypothetical protein